MKQVSELMNMKNRVALITGGAGHIGSAICDALAENGADIVIIDCNRDLCTEKCEQLTKDYGVTARPLVIDLASEMELRKVPETVLKQFGSLDVLVNCAALVGTSELNGWGVGFREQNANTWRLALEINLTAPFILTQVCSEALALSHRGSVINIASIYGINGPDMQLYEGTSLGNPAAYAASKGGLIQLTRWLATVLSPDVRVNAITLGGVYRGQPEQFHAKYIKKTPLQRMATEEDIKGAALFLASDLSAYVTGQNLVVDGGFTVW
ncbi:MAG: SDR family oxidoreductase [Methanoregula sp.]|jgi:NAD(P)-dependent dehydrogenase (short-subunit alcohol dehydrogenase family)|uniref:SDR family oxidoreductase n=1 Tax=Methanoregula sp. TaxID=2052170 RepID=UPI0025D51603|nr:SDR family oxidoreductase [Methanoregula sp.]MCK9630277.1 SDR family oxidoreductase [Methanoregula sp.]